MFVFPAMIAAQTYDIADKFWEEANAQVDQGNYLKAAELFELSAEAERICEHPREEDLYLSLRYAGVYYNWSRNYNKALDLAMEATSLSLRLYGLDHENFRTIYNDVGNNLFSLGLYNDAIRVFNEVIEFDKKNNLENSHAHYEVLNNIANSYYFIGQYEIAAPFYINLINLTKESDVKKENYAIYLLNAANNFKRMVLYKKAWEYYLEAELVAKEIYGSDHIRFAFFVNELGLFYLENKVFHLAIRKFREAANIAENTLGKNSVDYGNYLHNLANAYAQNEDLELALPLYFESAELSISNFDSNEYTAIIRLKNFAAFLNITGDYNNAVIFYEQALELYKGFIGSYNVGYLELVIEIADFYKTNGDKTKALSFYQDLLQNFDFSRINDFNTFNEVFYSLMMLNESNLFEQALAFYDKSYNLLLDKLTEGLKLFPEKEKALFANTVSHNFEIYQSFFFRNKDHPESAGKVFDIELASKGLVLNSALNVKNIIYSSDDDFLINYYEDLMNVKEFYTYKTTSSVIERQESLKTIEEIESTVTYITSGSPKYNSIGKTRWVDIKNALKKNEVAIEFSAFNYHNGNSWTDSIIYTAAILKHGDIKPHIVYLFEQREIDNLLVKGSNALAVNALYRGAFAHNDDYIDYSTNLYSLLWKPFESLIPDGSTVFYSPSGILHQIAFSAIPDDNADLLSDKYKLMRVGTTAYIIERDTYSKIGFASIALFGGINYESIDNAPYSGYWQYLPGSLFEVEAIESLASNNEVESQVFIGENALESSFKSLNGRVSADIIHVASHGFFYPNPRKAEEAIDYTLNQGHVYSKSDNPLNRSGLLFAGANANWGKATRENTEDDGILTATEVSNLYFGNTKLVVLSACETGLGDIEGNEGVFGLQRAFKLAGVDYLLMSLWKVPDKETAEFMKVFYESLFSENSILDAFQTAQKYMKSKYPNDPYKWAAFVLMR